jgi:hypothetical protein
VAVKQTFGPRYVFQGKLIAETEWQASGNEGAYTRRIAIWESVGGALIASIGGVRSQGAPVRATAVAPGENIDEQRFAILEHLNWHPRARDLAKQLGWSLDVRLD